MELLHKAVNEEELELELEVILVVAKFDGDVFCEFGSVSTLINRFLFNGVLLFSEKLLKILESVGIIIDEVILLAVKFVEEVSSIELMLDISSIDLELSI